jgi:cellulose synthase operon protein C
VRSRDAVVVLLVAWATDVALAHGPMLPERFVRARESALLTPPTGTFAWEVARLIPKPDAVFSVVEAEDRDSHHRSSVETEGLQPELTRKIAAMRAEHDDGRAYAIGEGLPNAVREYTAGAVSFLDAVPPRVTDGEEESRRTPPTADEARRLLEVARGHFQAVLDLPDSERASRVVWAQYMLGRTEATLDDPARAAEHFAATRALVRGGIPDPLGLAVASFGEEARLYLDSDIPRAVDLYARQTGYGSEGGLASLKRVLRRTLSEPALLDRGVTDPLTRRLLFAYAFTFGARGNTGVPDAGIDERNSAPDAAADAPEGDEPPGAHDRGSEEAEAGAPDDGADEAPEAGAPGDEPADKDAGETDEGTTPDDLPLLQKLADAVDRSGVSEASGADWLAATAYRAGRFDLADRFAARDTTPLAHWIRAKLALRRGDRDAALAAYASAVSAFRAEKDPPWPISDMNDDIVDPVRRNQRIDAEQGVLLLARGDFPQGLEHLLAGGPEHWMDAAYVAERVLTIDELKTYVDASVPLPTPSEIDAAIKNQHILPAVQLRTLLARRLLRSDRFDEAIAYFDDEESKATADEYVAARRAATSRWRPAIVRARAWYTAATLARFDGIEILGFEMEPDFAVVSGQYDLDTNDDEADPPPTAAQDVALISSSEQTRLDANAPSGVRFHYRVTAAEFAERAADLLPRSSQAFAAVLCEATTWLMTVDPARATVVYRRYLREGPYVPWGREFGRRCPAPDFDAAWWRSVAESLGPARRVVPRTRVEILLVCAASLVLVTCLILYVRRRRTPPALPKGDSIAVT